MGIFNVFRNLFASPAKDLILAAAVERVKIKILEKGMSENDRILAENLLDALYKEVSAELNKQ